MASIKQIELSQGKIARVDNEDFEWLNQWKWTFDATNGYAYRTQHLPSSRKNQKSKKIYMHRLLNQTPTNMLTDHIDRDRLNNTRSNLRTVTRSQNQINRGAQSNSKSGIIGVFWAKRDKAWIAELHINHVRLFRQSFKSKEDAIRARQIAEKRYHTIRT